MSRCLSSLKTVILAKSASEKEALGVLLELCDEDFSGRNGDEYVWECALAAGCDSNAEYCFKEALAEGVSYIEAIQYALKTQYVGDSYYYDYEIEVMEHDTCYFIATASMTQ